MEHSSPLAYALTEAGAKEGVIRHDPARYLLSAVMAGALISVVLVVSLKLGQLLLAAGVTGHYIAAAGFFGVALTSIMVCKVELFTSNVMYCVMGVLGGRMRRETLPLSWLMVYLGNLVGVLLFVAVLGGTGGLGTLPADHMLFDVVRHKTEAGWWAIFWKGVLCNWVICLATWVSLRLSNEAARLMMIMLLVFVFFFSGYEHSIANMGFFALAKWHGMALSWGEMLHNLVPATLGNIVGGGLGVGLAMFRLERHTLGGQAAGGGLPQAEAGTWWPWLRSKR